MRTFAHGLAPHIIRVNTVHPTGVNTPMVVNDAARGVDPRRRPARTATRMAEPPAGRDGGGRRHLQRVLCLVSDEARYVTGVTLPVDAGFLQEVDPRPPARRRREGSPRGSSAGSRELDLLLAAVVGRARRAARGPAGHVEVDDPRGDHRGVGRAAGVRRGQRRAHAGPAGGPPQPGAGAARGLHRPTTSCPGPWSRRCERGGFLYIEELNRAPEDTLNTLLTAMAEREVAVPRVGTIEALPTFRVRRVDEPVRHVGTTRISTRCTTGCAGSPSATRTRPRSGRSSRPAPTCEQPRWSPTRWPSPGPPASTPSVRQGSSVRGAIDIARRGRRWPSSRRHRRVPRAPRARRGAARALGADRPRRDQRRARRRR